MNAVPPGTPVALNNTLETAAQHRFGLPAERWSRLQGKWFWITGAGTGYGRSITLALMAAGANFVLSSRRSHVLQAVIDEGKVLGFAVGECLIRPLDLNLPEQIEAACEEINRLTGNDGLTGLVHCSAKPPPGSRWPSTDESWNDWDAIMNPNVRAPWHMVRNVFPALERNGHPRIVFLGSESGWHGGHCAGLYGVSKAALNNLVQTLSDEYGARYPELDLQLNLLEPGEARTEMNTGSPNSPNTVICMALLLLSQPEGGPRGRFFHRDGRHLRFGHSPPYDKSLV
jgi:3-oxoacyl-[acyl-carrier protein] reductase